MEIDIGRGFTAVPVAAWKLLSNAEFENAYEIEVKTHN
jgi:hypothetical protein